MLCSQSDITTDNCGNLDPHQRIHPDNRPRMSYSLINFAGCYHIANVEIALGFTYSFKNLFTLVSEQKADQFLALLSTDYYSFCEAWRIHLQTLKLK